MALEWQVKGEGSVEWRTLTYATSWASEMHIDDIDPSSEYRLVASNSFGPVVSDTVRVHIGVAPVIAEHPVSAVAAPAGEVAFGVEISADTTVPVEVQWYYSTDGGRAWRFAKSEWDATSPLERRFELRVAPVGLELEGVQFQASVTSNFGHAISTPATLTILDPIAILSPTPGEVSRSGDRPVVVSGTAPTGAGPLRWFFGPEMSGQTEVGPDGTWTVEADLPRGVHEFTIEVADHPTATARTTLAVSSAGSATVSLTAQVYRVDMAKP